MLRQLRQYWPAYIAILVVSSVIAIPFTIEQFSPNETYPSTNYSKIEEGLYLGGILSEPPPTTRAVLNVCETRDPYQAEVHSWQPIPDAEPAPSLDWLRKQVEFIDQQRRAGLPVFVHCRAGVSRSAMVVAAYFMFRDSCTPDEALATITIKRPRIHPNPAFMRLLLEWEETIKVKQR